VELLEPVGPVTYVDVRLGDVPMRASVPAGAALEPGQTVGIEFEPDSLHFFDRESGVRIAQA
jgi:ABC-type sugar transport system ATPase subunit